MIVKLIKVSLFTIFLMLFSTIAIFGSDRYLSFNPQVKIGTEMGNGLNQSNNFLETTFGKFKYRFNEKFAVSGGGSVGFTGKGKGLGANHFYNRLSLKSSYYVISDASIFMEGTWASLISGSNNPVEYFQQGNYQAIGFEMDGFTIFDALYGKDFNNPSSMVTYESKFKLGKYENSNFFAELLLVKISARINDYLSLAGGLSFGATAPRANFKSWKYYSSRATGRLTLRPFKGIGYFLEASLSKVNGNNPSYSPYFASTPYVALGAEIKGISFFGK